MSLLEEIWSFPLVSFRHSQTLVGHPCSTVVRSQNATHYEVPKPWSRDLVNVPLLFVNHNSCMKPEDGCPRNGGKAWPDEVTLTTLLGKEHPFPRPLVSEAIGTHHAANIETNDRHDAIVTFKSRDTATAKNGGWESRVCLLVFSGVAILCVSEEFNAQHRKQDSGKGYVSRVSFYQVRNSKTLKAVFKRRKVRLTHWIFYVWRMRVAAIAERVSLRSNCGGLRLKIMEMRVDMGIHLDNSLS